MRPGRQREAHRDQGRRTRSRAPPTALSGRPTRLSAGMPGATCTCTSTARASMPSNRPLSKRAGPLRCPPREILPGRAWAWQEHQRTLARPIGAQAKTELGFPKSCRRLASATTSVAAVTDNQNTIGGVTIGHLRAGARSTAPRKPLRRDRRFHHPLQRQSVDGASQNDLSVSGRDGIAAHARHDRQQRWSVVLLRRDLAQLQLTNRRGHQAEDAGQRRLSEALHSAARVRRFPHAAAVR